MNNPQKHLHIISFTVPYPANYGGVIDVFEKIKALHILGTKIHLHCFTYDRLPANELEQYCEEVYYYPRKLYHPLSWLHPYPYIIASRRDLSLLRRLKDLKAPILMEGIHATFYARHRSLKDYPKFLRMHNDEAAYYLQLAAETQYIFKKWYYKREARRLTNLTAVWRQMSHVFSISKTEHESIQKHGISSTWIPAFHSAKLENPTQQKRIPFLYHGDLSILSNKKVALSLAKVFYTIQQPLVIAGRTKTDLENLFSHYPNVRLISNPGNKKMTELLQEAECHLVFASHQQGVKLKLIHSVLSGAKVIANKEALAGSGLESVIPQTSIEALPRYLQMSHAYPFERVFAKAQSIYDNQQNAKKIMDKIIS